MTRACCCQVDRLSSENEKLREVVGLLQDKLSGAEYRSLCDLRRRASAAPESVDVLRGGVSV